MLVRECAGGVIFHNNQVFILKNDKDEWVLPKGVIKNGKLASEVAVMRVRYEGGVKANIISPVGETSYEYYSRSHRCQIFNKVNWFVMEAETSDYSVNKMEGFKDGGYYSLEEAIEKLTHGQNKALVNYSYRKYQEYLSYLKKEKAVNN